MWLLGDWGQTDPWTRASGVRMVKGEDGLYTGILTLPKGTRFDLKILKNPTAGPLIWSATRYASVLNSDGAYDFGEFVDNLVPNGNFDEGNGGWTPDNCIGEVNFAQSGTGLLIVGGSTHAITASSDTFVIPPNQPLVFSFFLRTPSISNHGKVSLVDVDTQKPIFSGEYLPAYEHRWLQFTKRFKTASDRPVMAKIVAAGTSRDDELYFDTMSLVSP